MVRLGKVLIRLDFLPIAITYRDNGCYVCCVDQSSQMPTYENLSSNQGITC
jgi:hypothetical protein